MTKQISKRSSRWFKRGSTEIFASYFSKSKLTTAMYVFTLLLLLLLLRSSFSSSGPVHCPHLPASSSSRWKERMMISRQHPNLISSHNNHHLARLRTNLRELAMMIENKKERFSQDEMGATYLYLERAHSHISYEAILPRGALAAQQDRTEDLKLVYDIFQRLAILVEVVKADIGHHRDASRGTQHLWQLVERGLVRVLEQVFMELRTTIGEEVLSPLTREEVPEWLRCMVHSVERDKRDFIVLRDTLHATNFFYEQLESH